MPLFSKAQLLKQGLFIGGCLALGSVCAGGPEPAPVFLGLPPPGASVYGMGGNGWTAIGDALIPVFGHPDGFVYADPQFYYHSDNGYSGSLGLGYRRLVDNTTGILGAYVFGDYNRSTDDHNFWFVSPGIERLGQILDFSANAYIPVSTQRINTGTTFAENVGDSSQIIFSGHDQFDALVNTFTSTGYGGDAQVGVHLPFFRNSEVFLGGYYFAPKDTRDIGGGAVRLQVPVNRFLSVLVSDAYDSEYHNTFKAGLTLWFGGRSTGYDFTGNLVERLVDPVQRGLVIVAGGSATLEPSISDFDNTGETALVLSNISFFVPETAPAGESQAVQGNGTFENPYVGITQDNVDNANMQNNRNFFVDSGAYNPVYAVGNDYIILNNDQVFGRQNEFREAAQGAARPLIVFADGGFEVPNGDVNDSFTGLQLVGMNVNGRAGIWIDHDNGLFDLTVGIDNTSVKAFGDGIDILNGGSKALTVNIDDSWISGNNGSGELLSTFGVTGGIGAMNNLGTGLLKINISDTTVKANNKSFDNQTLTAAGGMAVANMGSATTVNVNSSAFIDNAVSAINMTSIQAAGGMAIVNEGEQSLVTVNADSSNFSDNSIFLDNSRIISGGGLAVQSLDLGEIGTHSGANVTLNICKSNFSDNSITAEGASNMLTAGGLAANLLSADSDMILNIIGSTFIGNSIINDTIFDPSSANTIAVTGGLAARNSNIFTVFGESHVTLNVSYSDFSGNTSSITSAGTRTNAAGGLAISDIGAFTADTLILNLSHSNLSNNTISNDGGLMDVAGGLAVRAFNGTVDVNVKSSNFSGNEVSADNGGRINTAGGVALFNTLGLGSGGAGVLTAQVDRSNISGNTVSADHVSTINAAGGLAFYNSNQFSTMSLDISHTNISGNSIYADNTSTMLAAGGLAIAYTSGTLSTVDVDVSHSNISNNSVHADHGSSISAAGGVALSDPSIQSNMMLTVSHSNISNNSVTANNNGNILAAGGLAISNNPDQSLPNTMFVNIDHSKFSHNIVDGTSGVIGGVAVENSNGGAGGSVNVAIEKSKLLDNSGSGIDVSGSQVDPLSVTTVTVDKSIIAGNESFGLSADYNSSITVTNPIFFDGVVNIQNNSSITFPPNVGALTTNAHVVCPLLGPCHFVNP